MMHMVKSSVNHVKWWYYVIPKTKNFIQMKSAFHQSIALTQPLKMLVAIKQNLSAMKKYN